MRDASRKQSHRLVADEHGTALVGALVILLALFCLTTAALMATSSDLKISSNYQTGTQALLNAQ